MEAVDIKAAGEGGGASILDFSKSKKYPTEMVYHVHCDFYK